MVGRTNAKPKASSSGLCAQVVVTAPSGSTVTASKGSVSVSGVSDGTCTLTLNDYGVWTVTATLGTDSASDTAIVNKVKRYEITLEYTTPIDDVFSNNSWETIVAVCQENNVPSAWAVGDSKPMTINGVDYQIDIIGKNHDTYSSGGTAPLTFQLHDCYGTMYQMNTSSTNSGGWASCLMRTSTMPALLSLMPADVQVAIQEVNKLTSAGSQSSAINTTVDKLFLLSEIEIFGNTTNSKSGEGTQYAYYAAGGSRIKKFSNLADYWWERSPRGSNSTYFCRVTGTGVADRYYASFTNGVSFAFCF